MGDEKFEESIIKFYEGMSRLNPNLVRYEVTDNVIELYFKRSISEGRKKELMVYGDIMKYKFLIDGTSEEF